MSQSHPRSSVRWLSAALLGLMSLVAHAAPTVSIATSNGSPVVGGAAFNYTVTVTNPDGVAANNLAMSLPMPPAVLFFNLAIAGTGAGAFSCNQPAVGTNGQILCRAVSLAAGTAATFTVVAQIQPDVASGVRTATARLTAGAVETSSSVQTNQQVSAPLSVTLSGPGSAPVGSRISYLVTLNNSGGSTAINATLSGVLPAGFSHFSAQGTNALANACDYTASTRTLSCAQMDVSSGFSKLTWTVEVAPNMPTGPAQVSFTISNAGSGTISVGSSSVITTITN